MDRVPLELDLLRKLHSGDVAHPNVTVRILPISVKRYGSQQMLEDIELMAWSLSQPNRLY